MCHAGEEERSGLFRRCQDKLTDHAQTTRSPGACAAHGASQNPGQYIYTYIYDLCYIHCTMSGGLVVSVSASHTVGREFASRTGHTKDHHKNGTNCLPAWHAMR